MTTWTSSNISPFKTNFANGEWGVAWEEIATVTFSSAPATGDLAEFLYIPNGVEIHSVEIVNTSLGSAAPINIGYQSTDGTTVNATAFASAYAAGTATSAGNTYTLLYGTPVAVDGFDAFLTATFGTVSSGASGSVTIRAIGKVRGVK